MANFIKRVMDHLFNQVLVEGLANSRWFQKFAVNSNEMLKQMQEKGKGNGSVLNNQFRAEFNEELAKVQSTSTRTKPTMKK
eukprot:gene22708-29860_t